MIMGAVQHLHLNHTLALPMMSGTKKRDPHGRPQPRPSDIGDRHAQAVDRPRPAVYRRDRDAAVGSIGGALRARRALYLRVDLCVVRADLGLHAGVLAAVRPPRRRRGARSLTRGAGHDHSGVPGLHRVLALPRHPLRQGPRRAEHA
ncbi:hypothetical protein CBM2626_B110102 [Cupriavidus taiwanensis]|nr:hypothetical protein CBM2626_B110102 [Cupriavidus taiwanensis]